MQKFDKEKIEEEIRIRQEDCKYLVVRQFAGQPIQNEIDEPLEEKFLKRILKLELAVIELQEKCK